MYDLLSGVIKIGFASLLFTGDRHGHIITSTDVERYVALLMLTFRGPISALSQGDSSPMFQDRLRKERARQRGVLIKYKGGHIQ